MRLPNLLFLTVGGALLFLLCTSAAARAAVEFCPAKAGVPFPVGTAFGTPSAHYAYDLTALTPRTVYVTLIADTDHGWYRWDLSGIALTNVKRYIHNYPRDATRLPDLPYTVAASPTLAVDFPVPVTVRHAWVASVGKNRSPCDVPAFDSAKDKEPEVDVSPTPSTSYTPAVATSTQAPFEIGYCALKFANSTVVRPVRPNPTSVDPSYGRAAIIATALDPNGYLTDAWVYDSSGNAAFDHAALLAAKASTYVGAVSYCRPVRSTFLFMATFTPYYQ
ncbi:MAG TPA: hypothetical protein VGI19_04445 [Candidatus Cybelea sp.]|jgi:TonB family protein